MKIRINKKILNYKYLQFYSDDTPTQIYFGAASSGKSYSLFTFCVLWALQGRSILVARKINRSLRKSVFAEMCKAISRLKLTKYFTVNNTELTITCDVSNGGIVCVGASDPERLKSITPIKGSAFDCIIFEEVTELLETDFDLINSRMRGSSGFKKKVIMLFNPVSKSHWIFNRFFAPIKWDDEVDMNYKSTDLSITRCLYSDNAFLGEEEVKRMEALKDVAPRFWRVYGAGKFGITENSVFSNYKIEAFNINELTKLPMFTGVDFGYTHRSSCVFSRYDAASRTIYVYAEIGVKNKTRREFGQMIKSKIDQLGIYNPLIIADSAEPASIKELQQAQLNITSCKKGPDSVRRGYDFLLGHQIIVHPSCQFLISELETLVYEKDSTGEYKEIPIKSGDDMVMGLMYSFNNIYMIQGNVAFHKSKLY